MLLLTLSGMFLTPPATAAGTVVRPDPVQVLVVLDVSGSMAQPAGAGGVTRLQAARRALRELVGSLPEGTSVGLRVYGARYPGKDRAVACRDTQLLAPIRARAPESLLDAADGLTPTGDTPIGLALKYAASDLALSRAEGQPVIVLISDGQDNCSPPATPPCQVVQGLKNQGVKVRIETVGVSLENDGGAASALQCIARRTGGNYYDASNAEAISAALERISRETINQLGPGRAVARVPARRGSPTITPGTYQFALRPGQVAWFRFKTTKGARPRVLATVDGSSSLRVPKGARNCPAWRAELFNPYGEGGTYPPYGNSGEFDGVGIGSTGASSTGRLDPYSGGIDFTGTWSMQLSLARDTADTCSQGLPGQAYPVRFSLALGGVAASTSGASPGASPSASPSPSGAAAQDEGLRRKYDDPAVPGATPAWVPAVVAVTATLLAVGGGVLVRQRVRRRRRGW